MQFNRCLRLHIKVICQRFRIIKPFVFWTRFTQLACQPDIFYLQYNLIQCTFFRISRNNFCMRAKDFLAESDCRKINIFLLYYASIYWCLVEGEGQGFFSAFAQCLKNSCRVMVAQTIDNSNRVFEKHALIVIKF